jgi:hypothetical protein
MAIFKIPNRVIELISSKISALFDQVKVKFLGPRGADKHVEATFNPELSLPGMYEAASREEGGLPNLQTLSTLTSTSKNYLDALKLKTINATIKDLEEKANKPEDVSNILQENWKKTTAALQKIIETETQGTKNIALLDGIIRSNKTFGVEDPLVAFVIVRDETVCDECVRLHCLEDGITPKVWRLSELAHNYHHLGDEVPSIYGLHPHCRCQLITLLPGYGFNENGKVRYITRKHDEYEKQRSKD